MIKYRKNGQIDKRTLPKTEKAKATISRSLKKTLATPEARKIKSDAAKACANPEDKRHASEVRWAKLHSHEDHSKKMIRVLATPEMRKKISENTKIGQKASGAVEKIGRASKHIWKNEEHSARRVSKVLANRPISRHEKVFDRLVRRLGLPYVFVGNGKLMIGRWCPDFSRTDGKKIVIELNGGGHYSKLGRKRDKKRYKRFMDAGYHIVPVSTTELTDKRSLASRMLEFENLIQKTYKTQAPQVWVKV